MIAAVIFFCAFSWETQVEDRYYHSQFDLPKWEGTYSNHIQDKPNDDYQFYSICGPFSLACIEQHRNKLTNLLATQQSIPTDVFVWSVGEPQQPYLTKTGGMPYWPRDREWPTSNDGVPLNFIAQMCFLDSSDVVEDLPGDVLLLFCKGDVFSPDEFEVRWAKVADDTTLWTLEEAPQESENSKVPKLFGSIFRSKDYFQGPSQAIKDVDNRYDNSKLFIFNAFKIGGEATYVQNNTKRDNERFVCQFSSIVPIPGYSFLNLQELPNRRTSPMSYSKGFSLPLGDGGVICVYQDLENRDQFRVEFETH